MSVKPFSIIVATAKDGGIGVNGNLPWRLSGDMAFFKRITVRHSWCAVYKDFEQLSRRAREAKGSMGV
jgi:dihydrofolate reductase